MDGSESSFPGLDRRQPVVCVGGAKLPIFVPAPAHDSVATDDSAAMGIEARDLADPSETADRNRGELVGGGVVVAQPAIGSKTPALGGTITKPGTGKI